MSQKLRKKKRYSPDFAVSIAEGFYQVGFSVARQLEHDQSYFGFIGIMPAAVNFSLSTELFLKSVHMLYLRKCPVGHDIWSLYKNLPDSLRLMIKAKYDSNQRNMNQDHDKLASFKIVVKRTGQGSEGNDKDNDDSSPTIESLLRGHNNAFVAWRYLHEIPSPDGYEHKYDFKSMNAFVLAIRDIAYDRIKERGPKMQMSRVGPTKE
jgi:hypothetical protein